jgi:von Willebrand factor type A domain
VGVSFLTPLALLFGFLVAVPLAVFGGRRRRAAAVRTALGLTEGTGRAWLVLAICLAAVPILVGVAAAQPVITSVRTVPERSDVEVWIVVDTSRSMLASASSRSPTRFARAQEDVIALQDRLRDVPLGLASFTDRVLPHLFPTVDQRVFRETTSEALGIERPPPSTSFGTNVTSLDALGAVPTLAFFNPETAKRALVVFTDGESQPVSTLGTDFAQENEIDVTFVKMGDGGDQIWEGGVSEAAYAPDPDAGETLAAAAAAVEGRVLAEGEVAEVAAAIRAALGTGPTTPRRIEGNRQALMPYVALLVVLPLGLVLYRRNF